MKAYLAAYSKEIDPKKEGGDAVPGKKAIGAVSQELLNLPLGAKLPLLPGSGVLLYTTKVGEKLHQPSSDFNLSDPNLHLLKVNYKSLHDPYMSSYFRRKDVLKRLKQQGVITENNKILCTLKEFNQYRQYLTSVKLDFEKKYMREQRSLVKQMLNLQEEGVAKGLNFAELQEWLMFESKKNVSKKTLKERYMNVIQQNVNIKRVLKEQKCGFLEDDGKGDKQRANGLIRFKQEEQLSVKEKSLTMRIEHNAHSEFSVEQRRRKTRQDRARKKQELFEKKMDHQVQRLNQYFEEEKVDPNDLFDDLGIFGKQVGSKKLRRADQKHPDEKWARLARGECAIRPSILKDKLQLRCTKSPVLTMEELSRTVRNVIAWVVAVLTKILYPAIRQYEELGTEAYRLYISEQLPSPNQMSPSDVSDVAEDMVDHVIRLVSQSPRSEFAKHFPSLKYKTNTLNKSIEHKDSSRGVSLKVSKAHLLPVAEGALNQMLQKLLSQNPDILLTMPGQTPTSSRLSINNSQVSLIASDIVDTILKKLDSVIKNEWAAAILKEESSHDSSDGLGTEKDLGKGVKASETMSSTSSTEDMLPVVKEMSKYVSRKLESLVSWSEDKSEKQESEKRTAELNLNILAEEIVSNTLRAIQSQVKKDIIQRLQSGTDTSLLKEDILAEEIVSAILESILSKAGPFSEPTKQMRTASERPGSDMQDRNILSLTSFKRSAEVLAAKKKNVPALNVPGMVLYSQTEEVSEVTKAENQVDRGGAGSSHLTDQKAKARKLEETLVGALLPNVPRRDAKHTSEHDLNEKELDYKTKDIPVGSLLEKLFKKQEEAYPTARIQAAKEKAEDVKRSLKDLPQNDIKKVADVVRLDYAYPIEIGPEAINRVVKSIIFLISDYFGMSDAKEVRRFATSEGKERLLFGKGTTAKFNQRSSELGSSLQPIANYSDIKRGRTLNNLKLEQLRGKGDHAAEQRCTNEKMSLVKLSKLPQITPRSSIPFYTDPKMTMKCNARPIPLDLQGRHTEWLEQVYHTEALLNSVNERFSKIRNLEKKEKELDKADTAMKRLYDSQPKQFIGPPTDSTGKMVSVRKLPLSINMPQVDLMTPSFLPPIPAVSEDSALGHMSTPKPPENRNDNRASEKLESLPAEGLKEAEPYRLSKKDVAQGVYQIKPIPDVRPFPSFPNLNQLNLDLRRIKQTTAAAKLDKLMSMTDPSIVSDDMVNKIFNIILQASVTLSEGKITSRNLMARSEFASLTDRRSTPSLISSKTGLPIAKSQQDFAAGWPTLSNNSLMVVSGVAEELIQKLLQKCLVFLDYIPDSQTSVHETQGEVVGTYLTQSGDSGLPEKTTEGLPPCSKGLDSGYDRLFSLILKSVTDILEGKVQLPKEGTVLVTKAEREGDAQLLPGKEIESFGSFQYQMEERTYDTYHVVQRSGKPFTTEARSQKRLHRKPKLDECEETTYEKSVDECPPIGAVAETVPERGPSSSRRASESRKKSLPKKTSTDVSVDKTSSSADTKKGKTDKLDKTPSRAKSIDRGTLQQQDERKESKAKLEKSERSPTPVKSKDKVVSDSLTDRSEESKETTDKDTKSRGDTPSTDQSGASKDAAVKDASLAKSKSISGHPSTDQSRVSKEVIQTDTSPGKSKSRVNSPSTDLSGMSKGATPKGSTPAKSRDSIQPDQSKVSVSKSTLDASVAKSKSRVGRPSIDKSRTSKESVKKDLSPGKSKSGVGSPSTDKSRASKESVKKDLSPGKSKSGVGSPSTDKSRTSKESVMKDLSPGKSKSRVSSDKSPGKSKSRISSPPGDLHGASKEAIGIDVTTVKSRTSTQSIDRSSEARKSSKDLSRKPSVNEDEEKSNVAVSVLEHLEGIETGEVTGLEPILGMPQEEISGIESSSKPTMEQVIISDGTLSISGFNLLDDNLVKLLTAQLKQELSELITKYKTADEDAPLSVVETSSGKLNVCLNENCLDLVSEDTTKIVLNHIKKAISLSLHSLEKDKAEVSPKVSGTEETEPKEKPISRTISDLKNISIETMNEITSAIAHRLISRVNDVPGAVSQSYDLSLTSPEFLNSIYNEIRKTIMETREAEEREPPESRRRLSEPFGSFGEQVLEQLNRLIKRKPVLLISSSKTSPERKPSDATRLIKEELAKAVLQQVEGDELFPLESREEVERETAPSAPGPSAPGPPTPTPYDLRDRLSPEVLEKIVSHLFNILLHRITRPLSCTPLNTEVKNVSQEIVVAVLEELGNFAARLTSDPIVQSVTEHVKQALCNNPLLQNKVVLKFPEEPGCCPIATYHHMIDSTIIRFLLEQIQGSLLHPEAMGTSYVEVPDETSRREYTILPSSLESQTTTDASSSSGPEGPSMYTSTPRRRESSCPYPPVSVSNYESAIYDSQGVSTILPEESDIFATPFEYTLCQSTYVDSTIIESTHDESHQSSSFFSSNMSSDVFLPDSPVHGHSDEFTVYGQEISAHEHEIGSSGLGDSMPGHQICAPCHVVSSSHFEVITTPPYGMSTPNYQSSSPQHPVSISGLEISIQGPHISVQDSSTSMHGAPMSILDSSTSMHAPHLFSYEKESVVHDPSITHGPSLSVQDSSVVSMRQSSISVHQSSVSVQASPIDLEPSLPVSSHEHEIPMPEQEVSRQEIRSHKHPPPMFSQEFGIIGLRNIAEQMVDDIVDLVFTLQQFERAKHVHQGMGTEAIMAAQSPMAVAVIQFITDEIKKYQVCVSSPGPGDATDSFESIPDSKAERIIDNVMGGLDNSLQVYPPCPEQPGEGHPHPGRESQEKTAEIELDEKADVLLSPHVVQSITEYVKTSINKTQLQQLSGIPGGEELKKDTTKRELQDFFLELVTKDIIKQSVNRKKQCLLTELKQITSQVIEPSRSLHAPEAASDMFQILIQEKSVKSLTSKSFSFDEGMISLDQLTQALSREALCSFSHIGEFVSQKPVEKPDSQLNKLLDKVVSNTIQGLETDADGSCYCPCDHSYGDESKSSDKDTIGMLLSAQPSVCTLQHPQLPISDARRLVDAYTEPIIYEDRIVSAASSTEGSRYSARSSDLDNLVQGALNDVWPRIILDKLGPPKTGPTRQSPTRQGPTRQSPTRQGPTRQSPTRQSPTRQSPTRQGPSSQGPSMLDKFSKSMPLKPVSLMSVPFMPKPLMTVPSMVPSEESSSIDTYSLDEFSDTLSKEAMLHVFSQIIQTFIQTSPDLSVHHRSFDEASQETSPSQLNLFADQIVSNIIQGLKASEPGPAYQFKPTYTDIAKQSQKDIRLAPCGKDTICFMKRPKASTPTSIKWSLDSRSSISPSKDSERKLSASSSSDGPTYSATSSDAENMVQVVLSNILANKPGESFLPSKKTLHEKIMQREKVDEQERIIQEKAAERETILQEKAVQREKAAHHKKAAQHEKAEQWDKVSQRAKAAQREKAAQRDKIVEFERTAQHEGAVQRERAAQHERAAQREKRGKAAQREKEALCEKPIGLDMAARLEMAFDHDEQYLTQGPLSLRDFNEAMSKETVGYICSQVTDSLLEKSLCYAGPHADHSQLSLLSEKIVTNIVQGLKDNLQATPSSLVKTAHTDFQKLAIKAPLKPKVTDTSTISSSILSLKDGREFSASSSTEESSDTNSSSVANHIVRRALNEAAVGEYHRPEDTTPVDIVPMFHEKKIHIDPDIIADHLSVIAIKTESLEQLKQMSLSHTGHSLQEVRDATVTGSTDFSKLQAASHAHLQHGKLPELSRHSSLDFSGRIDVKPREVIARNSFINLLNPDISKVELLKDVKNKKDLIMRLVAHDVPPVKDEELDEINKMEEQQEQMKQNRMVDKILREDVGLYEISPETSESDDRQESSDSGLTVNLDNMNDIQDMELVRRTSVADKTHNDYVAEKLRYSNAQFRRSSQEEQPANLRNSTSDTTGNPQQQRNPEFKSSFSKYNKFSVDFNPQDMNREFYTFRDNFAPHPPLGRKSWNKSTSRVRFDSKSLSEDSSLNINSWKKKENGNHY